MKHRKMAYVEAEWRTSDQPYAGPLMIPSWESANESGKDFVNDFARDVSEAVAASVVEIREPLMVEA